MKRLEYSDEKSKKFWEIRVEGPAHTVRYGKLGTAGQAKTKQFASEAAARQDAEKLVAEKLKKGYAEVAQGEPPEAPPVELLDWDAPDGQNAFEQMLRASDGGINGFPLRSCLATSREVDLDPAGNAWHEFWTALYPEPIIFCVDHENGAIFGDIYPESVFESIRDGGEIDERYSENDKALARVLKREAPRFSKVEAEVRSELELLWARSAWVIAALFEDTPTEIDFRGFEQDLERPDFDSTSGRVVYWLLGCWLMEDERWSTVNERALKSPLRIARDAARFLDGLSRGARGPGKLAEPAALRDECREARQRHAEREARQDAKEESGVQDASKQRASIRFVNSSCRGLDELPDAIADFLGAESLDFSGNRVTAIAPELAKLQKLRRLDLSGHQLDVLPEVIAELTQLTHLNVGAALTGTSIGQLPHNLGALKALRELYLEHNRLTALPPSVGELESLEVLVLSWCSLEEVPAELGRLGRLRRLDLEKNALEALPDGLSALTKLEELSLARNSFVSLPAFLSALPALSKLDISGMPLCEDDWRVLAAMPALRDLAVGKDWTALSDDLGRLTGLEALSLSWSPRLEAHAVVDTLSKLPRLERLSLWGCHGPVPFQRMTGLKRLAMQKCLLPDASDVADHQLGHLRLQECETPNLATLLARLPGLEELELSECRFDVKAACELPSLQRLKMVSGPRGLPVGRWFPALRSLTTSDDVDLRGCDALEELEVRVGVFAKQAGLSTLRRLRLKNYYAGDGAALLACIAALPKLVELELNLDKWPKLPAALRSLEQLEHVSLSGKLQKNAGSILDWLAHLPKLKRLSLASTDLLTVTDEFAGFAGLEFLDLSHTAIAADLADEIRCLLPGTQVRVSTES